MRPRRLLAVLLAEHEEDLARLSGVLSSTGAARRATEEPVGRPIVHRLPWLVLGLLGALASAVVVRSFEDDLTATIALAFFLPGVVYMATPSARRPRRSSSAGCRSGYRSGRSCRAS